MAGDRVLFYVQHLLGVGHLRRASAIAHALDRAGFEADLVSGGMPEPWLEFGGARFVQLPPTRANDPSFESLVDAGGAVVDEGWMEHRREVLLGHFDEFRPDVLIVESYPFGRRQMRFELTPLLEAARDRAQRPLVLVSVREYVQAKRKPGRVEKTVALLRDLYDGVMVHGDPVFARFEESFPLASQIEDEVHYTGFVVAPEHRPGADDAAEAGAQEAGNSEAGRDEVIVSAGGGATARGLFAAAIEARGLSSLKDTTWRFLVGTGLPAPDREALSTAASALPGIIVEPARPDFRALLRRCAVSVSQAGYNTVMDLLSAGTRAVLVPFAGDHETEQPMRAARLAGLDLATVVEEAALSPELLAGAIDAAYAAPPPPPHGLDLGGAEASARLIGDLLAARRGAAARARQRS